ncbi:MAG: DUF5666 domain-containing protein [Thermaceae bacterium]|nr:DUF5666 domain-containing protein [Thermaceae bacterium]
MNRFLLALLGLGLAQSQTDRSYVEIKGFVGSYNPTAGYLTIGKVRVELKGARLEGRLSQGAYIEVKGRLNGTTLQATKAEVESSPSPVNKAHVELKGYVAAYDAKTGYLTIGGLRIETGQARIFGVVAQGSWVEVRGNWVDDGLQANRIEVSSPKVGS